MNEKMVLFLLIVGIGNCVLAQTITIGGQATYYDTESESVQPLVNTRVSLETYDPVIVTDDVYTNENGFYSFSFTGSQPVQITTRLYFTNLQVAIESYDGPRNDYNTVLPDYPGDCDPPTLPCDYTIPGELMDFNFSQGSEYNSYANIFMRANQAAEFASDHGYDPPQVTIRYPSSVSIINGIDIDNYYDIEASFFWPYPTLSTEDV